jgi:2-polyprenyl-3-methyl-5-hydroxy-6-metoxy-1,4-benzoquinol methylase
MNGVDNIKEFWDNCHKEGLLASLSGSKYDETIKALKLEEYMKPFSNVLEVGPGLGYVTKELYERGLNVSCLDISKLAFTKIEKYCEKIYTISDLEELPLDYFDVILCVNVIQHIPTDLLKEELRYCVRSLKVDGVFALEFVSNTEEEDMGINASMATITKGWCCRTPRYLDKLIKDIGGTCELVYDVKCDNGVVTGCHVFHVRKDK